jgi:serine/threonine protein phosphatase PrpC
MDDDLNCTVINVGDSRAHIITSREISDGLHDCVKKERIQEIVLTNGENVEKSCKELVE